MEFKMALIQAEFEFGALEGNLQKAEKKIQEAVALGSNFILLPESFNRG